MLSKIVVKIKQTSESLEEYLQKLSEDINVPENALQRQSLTILINRCKNCLEKWETAIQTKDAFNENICSITKNFGQVLKSVESILPTLKSVLNKLNKNQNTNKVALSTILLQIIKDLVAENHYQNLKLVQEKEHFIEEVEDAMADEIHMLKQHVFISVYILE